MKTLAAGIIFVLIATVVLFSASGGGGEVNKNISTSDNIQNANHSSSVSDDVEELGKIIKLPFEPEEVVWQDNNSDNKIDGNGVSAANQKRIIAVLKFTSEQSNLLIAQAEKYAPAKPAEIDAESWFPVELIAQSQLSGDETLKGNAYAADDFFMEQFNKGKFTHIANTNYFVLELTSF